VSECNLSTSRTKDVNLAHNSAPNNSNLGIVCLFIGATLALDTTLVWNFQIYTGAIPTLRGITKATYLNPTQLFPSRIDVTTRNMPLLQELNALNPP
jgi:hypothetical protein